LFAIHAIDKPDARRARLASYAAHKGFLSETTPYAFASSRAVLLSPTTGPPRKAARSLSRRRTINVQAAYDISTSIEASYPPGCFEASATLQSDLTRAKEFEL
jgi:hypothetical protein